MNNTMDTANQVAKTKNGMAAHATTNNFCTDLFFQIGSMRNWSDEQIVSTFIKAFKEDALTAMKVLFYSKDIILGQGERRTTRIIFEALAKSNPDILRKNLHLIPQFGRWDDIFSVFNTALENDALELIKKALIEDENGLCAKWMPNEHSKTFPGVWKKISNKLGLSPKEYRQILKPLRERANVVEQLMCANQWDKIDYNKVASIAMKNYRGVFQRHNEEGFSKYVESLIKGESKVNAKAIFPHDITKQLIKCDWEGCELTKITKEERIVLEKQWESLPDYLKDNNGKMMVVSDVSGSMYGLPMEVCVGLSLYISERNKGPFKNCVITFDNVPQFIELKAKTLSERAVELSGLPWGGSTNLEGTFDALLQRAIEHSVRREDMPETILILSDMQFNNCVKQSDTAYQMIEDKFKTAGYSVPKIVFWNLNAHAGTNPVEFNKRGTAMISGCSPSILRSVMSGSNFTPYGLMMQTICEERYNEIII